MLLSLHLPITLLSVVTDPPLPPAPITLPCCFGLQALSPTLNLESRLEAVALEAGLPPSPAQFLRLEAAFAYTSIHTRASSASSEKEVYAGGEEEEDEVSLMNHGLRENGGHGACGL